MAHTAFDFASAGSPAFTSRGSIDNLAAVRPSAAALRRADSSKPTASSYAASTGRKVTYASVAAIGALVCLAWWSALLWVAVKCVMFIF